MKKLNTLKREIFSVGFNGNEIVGIDKKNGECVIAEITVNKLMNGEYEYLMDYKVKDVVMTSKGLVFILNSNVIKRENKYMIYKELKRTLRDFENMRIGESELYEMLLKINENWNEITK